MPMSRGRTVHVENDALCAWPQDEQRPLGKGVVVWEQPHNRIVPWDGQNLWRHWDVLQHALQRNSGA